MKIWIRALPALLLWLLFPFVVLALVLGLGALGIWIAVHAGTYLGSRAVVFLLVPVFIGLFAAVGEARRLRRTRVRGPELSREQAPELWALVDRAAAGVGTRTVRRIVVTAEVNAAVTSRPDRALVLGLPMVELLAPDELAAVICHELGHYAGGRYALASMMLRARNTMTLMAQESGMVSGLVLVPYAWLFRQASLLSSRDLEHAADRFSARLVGPQATAAALRHTTVLDAVWSIFATNYAPLFDLAGRRAPIGDALRSIESAHADDLHQLADERIATEQPSRTDSHPVTRERIARVLALAPQADVDQPASDPEPDQAGHSADGQGDPWHVPSGDLLASSRDRVEAELVAGDLPVAAWSELVEQAEPVEARRIAGGILNRLAADGVVPQPTVRAAVMTNTTRPIGVAEGDVLAANREVLTWLVRWSLLESGRYRAVLDWQHGGAVDSLDPAQGRVDVAALVGDGGPVDSRTLLARLATMGAALDVAPPVPQRIEHDDDVVAVLTSLERGVRQPKTLLVLPAGLLLIKSVLAPNHNFGADAETQLARLGRVLAEGVDALRARRSSIWVPADQVRAIRVYQRRLSVRVDLETTEGTVLHFKRSAWCVNQGDAWTELAQRYGERFTMDQKAAGHLAKVESAGQS